jgi:polyisoprenoid-binding protein YceI
MALSTDQRQTHGAATTWRIDPDTSRVAFAIRQTFAFVPRPTVVGRFAAVSGTIVLDERRPATARVEVGSDAAGGDGGQLSHVGGQAT